MSLIRRIDRAELSVLQTARGPDFLRETLAVARCAGDTLTLSYLFPGKRREPDDDDRRIAKQALDPESPSAKFWHDMIVAYGPPLPDDQRDNLDARIGQAAEASDSLCLTWIEASTESHGGQAATWRPIPYRMQ